MTTSQDVDELAALPALAGARQHRGARGREVLRSADRARAGCRPGTRLREEQVSAAFSISRNTVREAFRLLSHERLVDHTLHRGVHVRTVGPDDVRVDVPAPVAWSSRSAWTPRPVTPPCWALRRLVDDAVGAAARGPKDWDVLGTADIEFHRVLMSACPSPHLSTMFEQLLAELRLAFLLLPDHRALHEPYVARNRPAGRAAGGGGPRRGPRRADGLPRRRGAAAAGRAVRSLGGGSPAPAAATARRHRAAPEAAAPGGPGRRMGRWPFRRPGGAVPADAGPGAASACC